MMAVYDLHDEMNPARLIGPAIVKPVVCGLNATAVAGPAAAGLAAAELEPLDSVTMAISAPPDQTSVAAAGRVYHSTGRPGPLRGGAVAEVAVLEPEIDHELDPAQWRDVCDPRTPPAPVATGTAMGLDAIGFAMHGLGQDPAGPRDQAVLSEAPTVPLDGSSRWRVIMLVAGVMVVLLVVPVVLVFMV